MKQWWLGLSLREKRLVSLGGIAILIFILYIMIWVPLTTNITSMRKRVTQNQKLLVWMQSADTQLEETLNQKKLVSVEQSSVSLISLTQNQIKQSPLANQLTQLRQAENDTVQLSFKQVNFDHLMTWLIDVWQKQGLTITQLTVTASDTPGIVSAELQLSY